MTRRRVHPKRGAGQVRSRRLRAVLLAMLLATPGVEGARLKDLVSVEGVRDNLLVGYGLVVGLKGTGDRQQTLFSTQTLANMLQRMGVNVDPAVLRVNNIAAVMVTATLPPYAAPGTRIDVTVSSIGDAASIQGGTLLLTALKASTGEIYAAAQGPVSIGGFAAGTPQNGVQVNHPTAGRIPGGALVERAAPTEPPGPAAIKLQLRRPDFSSAARIAAALNQKFGSPLAKAENSALIKIELPPEFRARPVDFVAAIEPVEIPSDSIARVVLNERTGTVVIGKDVRIAPVAILHGNLTVQIVTTFQVSQPAPLSPGQTVVAPQATVRASEEKTRNIVLKQGATVEDLIQALIGIGSTPRDVIAIMQSIAASGALDARVEVI